MPKIELYKIKKNKTYDYLDKMSRNTFNMGGTDIFIHLYKGPKLINDNETTLRQEGDLTQPVYDVVKETNIQDLLLLENRNRKYEENVYVLKGNYAIADNDFDLKQFGLFLTDTITISFHYNDMIAKLGRKLMSGDVLELPHLREHDLLNGDIAINKYYVINDASKPSEGYSLTWYNHFWSCKCKPIDNQQEFYDILSKNAKNKYDEDINRTLEDILSTRIIDDTITVAIHDEAERQVPYRNFETRHLYITPMKDSNGNIIERDDLLHPICLSYGDGVPPNGIPVLSGTTWPENANNGDYFLRTDYEPNILFRLDNGVWIRKEIDHKTRWKRANDLISSFINKTGTINYQDGSTQLSKRQSISKIRKPKEDNF